MYTAIIINIPICWRKFCRSGFWNYKERYD